MSTSSADIKVIKYYDCLRRNINLKHSFRLQRQEQRCYCEMPTHIQILMKLLYGFSNTYFDH